MDQPRWFRDVIVTSRSCQQRPNRYISFDPRFGGNDFEVVEFCLCAGSEHPNDGPELRNRRGVRSHDRVYQILSASKEITMNRRTFLATTAAAAAAAMMKAASAASVT